MSPNFFTQGRKQIPFSKYYVLTLENGEVQKASNLEFSRIYGTTNGNDMLSYIRFEDIPLKDIKY